MKHLALLYVNVHLQVVVLQLFIGDCLAGASLFEVEVATRFVVLFDERISASALTNEVERLTRLYGSLLWAHGDVHDVVASGIVHVIAA
jgi:hypothetical protein